MPSTSTTPFHGFREEIQAPSSKYRQLPVFPRVVILAREEPAQEEPAREESGDMDLSLGLPLQTDMVEFPTIVVYC